MLTSKLGVLVSPKKLVLRQILLKIILVNNNIQLTTPTSCKSSKTWAKRKEQTNARRRLLYKESPERKRNNSRKRYHMHASPVRKRVLEAYYSNPSPVKKQALDAYYNKHDINKAKKRQMYKVEKGVLINKHSIATLISCSISKKYSKLRSSPSKLESYVKKILAKLPEKSWGEKHLYVEHLIKGCLQYRET